jgi:hypothetical protein
VRFGTWWVMDERLGWLGAEARREEEANNAAVLEKETREQILLSSQIFLIKFDRFVLFKIFTKN